MFFEHVYKSWKPKQFAKYEQLSKQVDLKKLLHGKKVLDIACGPCWFEEFLSKQKIDVSNFLCVDKSQKHLGEKKVDVKTLETDVSDLSLPEKFDVIVALDCLHLFDFDFKKYLKKNGIVVASLFFSSSSSQKRALLKQKLKGLKIEKEIIVKGEENEVFVVAK